MGRSAQFRRVSTDARLQPGLDSPGKTRIEFQMNRDDNIAQIVVEARRDDADYGIRLAVEIDCLADHIGLTSVTALPETVRQNHDAPGLFAGRSVRCGKYSTQQGRNAQESKSVCRIVAGLDRFRKVFAAKGHIPIIQRDGVLHYIGLLQLCELLRRCREQGEE
jgi:hypothetical protein